MAQIEDITKKVALELKTVGLINMQFAVKDDVVYVIEANPRASRTVPFIAKAYREPYVTTHFWEILAQEHPDHKFTKVFHCTRCDKFTLE